MPSEALERPGQVEGELEGQDRSVFVGIHGAPGDPRQAEQERQPQGRGTILDGVFDGLFSGLQRLRPTP